jgi:uncharacterized protein YgfB (UPF0149 family)
MLDAGGYAAPSSSRVASEGDPQNQQATERWLQSLRLQNGINVPQESPVAGLPVVEPVDYSGLRPGEEDGLEDLWQGVGNLYVEKLNTGVEREERNRVVMVAIDSLANTSGPVKGIWNRKRDSLIDFLVHKLGAIFEEVVSEFPGVNDRKRNFKERANATYERYKLVLKNASDATVFGAPRAFHKIAQDIRQMQSTGVASFDIMAVYLKRLEKMAVPKGQFWVVSKTGTRRIVNYEVDATKSALFQVAAFFKKALGYSGDEEGVVASYRTTHRVMMTLPADETEKQKYIQNFFLGGVPERVLLATSADDTSIYRNILHKTAPATFLEFYRVFCETSYDFASFMVFLFPVLVGLLGSTDPGLLTQQECLDALLRSSGNSVETKIEKLIAKLLLFLDQCDAGSTIWREYVDVIGGGGLLPEIKPLFRNAAQASAYGDNEVDEIVRDATVQYEDTLTAFRMEMEQWQIQLAASMVAMKQGNDAGYIERFLRGLGLTNTSKDDVERSKQEILKIVQSVIKNSLDNAVAMMTQAQTGASEVKRLRIENVILVRENRKLKSANDAAKLSGAQAPTLGVGVTSTGGPAPIISVRELRQDAVLMAHLSNLVTRKARTNKYIEFAELFAGDCMMNSVASLLLVDYNELLLESVLRSCTFRYRDIYPTINRLNPSVLPEIVEVEADVLKSQFSGDGVYRPTLMAAKAQAFGAVAYMTRREGGVAETVVIEHPRLIVAYALLASRFYSREAGVHKKMYTTASDKSTTITALAEADLNMRAALVAAGYKRVALTSSSDF